MRFLLLISMIFVLGSCAQNNEAQQMREDICRKWRYDVEAIRAEVKGKLVSNREMEFMEGSLRKFSEGYVEFKSDGTLLLSNTGNSYMEGTWDFTDDLKQIRMNIYKRDDFAPIDELSADRLILGKQDNSVLFRRIFIPAE
jgi:hypothetical protein